MGQITVNVQPQLQLKDTNLPNYVEILSVISVTTVLSQKRWKLRLRSTSSSATAACCCLDHVYQPEASALLPLSQLIAAQFTRGNSSKFILLVELAKSNSAAQETMGAHREKMLQGLWWKWIFLSPGSEVVIMWEKTKWEQFWQSLCTFP